MSSHYHMLHALFFRSERKRKRERKREADRMTERKRESSSWCLFSLSCLLILDMNWRNSTHSIEWERRSMDSFCCLCENQHNLHIFSPSRSHSCLCSCFCLPAGEKCISFLTWEQGKRRVLVLRITLQIIRNDLEKIILSLQLFFAFTVYVIHSSSSFLLYSFHTHTHKYNNNNTGKIKPCLPKRVFCFFLIQRQQAFGERLSCFSLLVYCSRFFSCRRDFTLTGKIVLISRSQV